MVSLPAREHVMVCSSSGEVVVHPAAACALGMATSVLATSAPAAKATTCVGRLILQARICEG